MKRIIAMLSTGMAIGFALALAYADDTTRSNNGSADTSINQPGEMPGTIFATPGMEEDSMEQPGQTGDTSTTTAPKGEKQASKPMDTSKTCIDAAGVIHRAGTEAFNKCLKEKEKTHKEMGGQMGKEPSKEESSDEMSGESGERTESNY